jgi:hypothetical protein
MTCEWGAILGLALAWGAGASNLRIFHLRNPLTGRREKETPWYLRGRKAALTWDLLHLALFILSAGLLRPVFDGLGGAVAAALVAFYAKGIGAYTVLAWLCAVR